MATIGYQSNQTVDGTSGNDTMVGNDTAGNTNDIVYGHQGEDRLEFDFTLNDSTLYGGQGNDFVDANNSSDVYGNFGNDSLEIYGNSANPSRDTLFGGQGNDWEQTFFSSGDVLYGNLGNDFLLMDNAKSEVGYGGQGQDTVEQSGGAFSVLYGNQGNDFVEDIHAAGYDNAAGNSFAAEGSSVLYGGQGDDTLAAPEAGGDTLFGGLGHNLYAGNALLPSSSFSANDMLTVEGFVSGSDSLSMSATVAAQGTDPLSSGFMTKLDDPVSNIIDAMTAANAVYLVDTAPSYVFVYGGSGAGYLFYNGDNGGNAVNDGMILAGDNAEGSLQPSDVVASSFASA